jgi:hypothetical protein
MAENQVSVHQIYHIRVKGHLDEKWRDWFDGFVMVPRASGETLLTGPVADQAALYGVLSRIRDLNVPLLLLAQTDCPCPKRCPRHGLCQECAAYHSAKGKLPYCSRSKTKWDRQCAALVETR